MSKAKFIPQRKNANRHTQRGLRELEKSIQRDGWIGAVTVAADGETFDGSARIETLENVMPDTEPIVIDVDGNRPVIVRRTDIPNADDPRAKRLAIGANRIAQIDLEWDTDVLAEIAAQEGDLLDGLFDQNELAELIGQGEAQEETADVGELIDKAAELQKKWKCARGDIFEIPSLTARGKAHRLMCGDSTSAEDVARLMGGERAQLLFTSPPYSDMRTYEGGKNLEVDHLINFIPTFSTFAEYQVINLGLKRRDYEIDPYWNAYILKAQESGYLFLSWNVWNRSGAGGSVGAITAFFPIEHEWLLVFGKDYDKEKLNRTVKNKHAGQHRTGGDRQADGSLVQKHRQINEYRRIGTVQNIDFERDVKTKQSHPAVFPVALPSEFIGAMTNTGETVIEPFTGAGTTLVACEQTGRIGRGMEIEPKYVAVCLERLSLLGLTPKRLENE